MPRLVAIALLAACSPNSKPEQTAPLPTDTSSAPPVLVLDLADATLSACAPAPLTGTLSGTAATTTPATLTLDGAPTNFDLTLGLDGTFAIDLPSIGIVPTALCPPRAPRAAAS